MGGQRRPAAVEAASLRLRLYRPDPPVGAVPAYLRALRAVPVPAPPGGPPADRRPGALGAATTTAVLVAGLLAAVALGRQVPALAAAERPPAATGAAPTSTAPPVPGVPLGGFAGDDVASKAFTANGHQVAVGVVCSGGGTVAVRIGAEAPTVFTCDTAAFAIATSTTSLDRFTVVVTPDGPATWSVSAGALQL